jgi:hypothetical protein
LSKNRLKRAIFRALTGGNPHFHPYIFAMSKTAKPQTPEQIARAEKQRIARIEGDKALADFERNAIAVRKNMERLRALRLAKEAEEAENAPPVVKKTKSKTTKAVKDTRTKAQKLSDFLASQREAGRGT